MEGGGIRSLEDRQFGRRSKADDNNDDPGINRRLSGWLGGFLRNIHADCDPFLACGFGDPQMDETVFAEASEETEAVIGDSQICEFGRKRKKASKVINFSDIHGPKLLSKGAFCEIYSGSFGPELVVAKAVREDVKNRDFAEKCLVKELEALSYTSHEHIVELVGKGRILGIVPSLCISLEFLDGGTLKDLTDTRAAQQQKNRRREESTLTQQKAELYELIKIAISLAKALQYLHEEAFDDASIIHRDVKPANIGFKDGCLKLFDLGLAAIVPRRELQDDGVKMTGFVGTLRYMAPEVALEEPYGEKVDTYSYAMVIWEVMTAIKPFATFSYEDFFDLVIDRGQRPELSGRPVCPPSLKYVLARCWDEDPALRLSFPEAVETLEETLAELRPASPAGARGRRGSWFGGGGGGSPGRRRGLSPVRLGDLRAHTHAVVPSEVAEGGGGGVRAGGVGGGAAGDARGGGGGGGGGRRRGSGRTAREVRKAAAANNAAAAK